MLNFCNPSSAISISTVKNWVCYNERALKAGNRSVGKDFKAVTTKARKTGYTIPADTGLSCLLWRQLIKTVKAQSALKGLDGLQEIHHKTRKKGKQSCLVFFPLPRPPWCWSPLMQILPLSGWWEQCLLVRTAAAWEGNSDKLPQHLVFLAWKTKKKKKKRKRNVEHIAYIRLVQNVNKRWVLNEDIKILHDKQGLES